MRFPSLAGLATVCLLSACQTPPHSPVVDQTTRVVVASPRALPPAPPVATRPPPPVTEPPEEPVVEEASRFASVEGWEGADADPALAAFRLSCTAWSGADDRDMLAPALPQYGTFGDWREACAAAEGAGDAKAFFEAHFTPVTLSTPEAEAGLLTGYYEPEIAVRRVPTPEFSEPVLARPGDPEVQALPRRELGPRSSRVIAYGRPVDVFFMQVQGSGRVRFRDGLTLRAAFAGHNGRPYTSIGRVLVERGEMELSAASKGAIERWMRESGPEASRELMDSNARYVFFEEQSVPSGGATGPQGAMGVPLTPMGSVALDPRYHPYGTVAVLRTTLPERAGDFRGREATVVVVGQDTGGAIRGPLRGDLYFGSGAAAGELAGVMKHGVRWTLLLPRGLGERSVAGVDAGVRVEG